MRRSVARCGVRLVVMAYGADDVLEPFGPEAEWLAPGAEAELAWTVALPIGCPIAWIGLESGFERARRWRRLSGLAHLGGLAHVAL